MAIIHTPLLLPLPALLRTLLIAHNSTITRTTASTIQTGSICMGYLLMVFQLGEPKRAGFI